MYSNGCLCVPEMPDLEERNDSLIPNISVETWTIYGRTLLIYDDIPNV